MTRRGGFPSGLARLVNESDADLVDVRGTDYAYGRITPRVRVPAENALFRGFYNRIRF